MSNLFHNFHFWNVLTFLQEKGPLFALQERSPEYPLSPEQYLICQICMMRCNEI